jgi:glycosyltransferase involved in cell wall biosynthesis
MRILVANKFWYRRGGLESVMFDEIAWLEGAGHAVAHFSTAHPLNDPSPWDEYFVPYVELGADGPLGPAQRAMAAMRLFSNRDAARRFDELCATFNPDVIHVHGIHRQISPSILGIARRRSIHVVQSLHDYHHVCPADVLLYAGRETCEPRRCGEIWYGPAIAGRCVRRSLSASAVSAAETSFQRLSRAYERSVVRFISPSVFLADSMLAGGWEIPIDVVPNATSCEAVLPGDRSGFCLIGRLSHEKGVRFALEAARAVGGRVTVAGEGPLGQELRAAYPDVAFVGRLDSTAVADLVRRSMAVIVPSVWFENAPMSVLEAMSSGTPVIASAIGGIPEQITDGVDGLLVQPGEVDALAVAMRALLEDSTLATRLGTAARATVAQRFSPELHLQGLLACYRAAGASS